MNESKSDTINITYITTQVLLQFLVFSGNLLIILVICFKKSLYENNTLRIVLSLSITDLFLSITVLPFTTYSQSLEWNLGLFPCALWLCNDLQLKTTSIFHLCSITYERYLSIAKPMIFRINIKKRILYLVIFNWTASFMFVTLPFLVLITLDTRSIYSNTCNISSSVFIAYTTVVTFWIPLVIMMFFGCKALFLIRKIDKSHLKMNSKLSSLADMTPRNSFVVSESSKDSRHSVVYLETKPIDQSSSSEMLNKTGKDPVRNRSSSLNYIYKRKKMDKSKLNLKNIPTINILDTNGEVASSEQSSPENIKLLNQSFPLEKSREESQVSDDSNTFVRHAAIRRPSRLSAFRLSIFGNPIRKELKAQKTLTIALVVFLVSYFPFFTFLTITSFKELLENKSLSIKLMNNDKFMKMAYYWTTWLAYSSAAINPILQFSLNNNLKNGLKNTFVRKKK